jgi:hypothetical protein
MIALPDAVEVSATVPVVPRLIVPVMIGLVLWNEKARPVVSTTLVREVPEEASVTPKVRLGEVTT